MKGISIRGHKREARIEGTFCGNSPLTGGGLELLLERAILEDQEKAGVVSRRPLCRSSFFFFALISR